MLKQDKWICQKDFTTFSPFFKLILKQESSFTVWELLLFCLFWCEPGCFYVLGASACVWSGCSGFLPQSKNMQVRWQNSKLPVGVNVSVRCVYRSACISPAMGWQPLQRCTPPLTQCMLGQASAPRDPEQDEGAWIDGWCEPLKISVNSLAALWRSHKQIYKNHFTLFCSFIIEDCSHLITDSIMIFSKVENEY